MVGSSTTSSGSLKPPTPPIWLFGMPVMPSWTWPPRTAPLFWSTCRKVRSSLLEKRTTTSRFCSWPPKAPPWYSRTPLGDLLKAKSYATPR